MIRTIPRPLAALVPLLALASPARAAEPPDCAYNQDVTSGYFAVAPPGSAMESEGRAIDNQYAANGTYYSGARIRDLLHAAGSYGYQWDCDLAAFVATPPPTTTSSSTSKRLGAFMLYSSGTVGRPKGVARPLSGAPAAAGPPEAAFIGGLFGMGEHSVYLSPAPRYHSAPAAFTVAATALGGTVVMMERFDPVEALAAIERHQVTHSQWVPRRSVGCCGSPRRNGAGSTSPRIAPPSTPAPPAPARSRRQCRMVGADPPRVRRRKRRLCERSAPPADLCDVVLPQVV
jgi:acyl-CoA synthetase (AMP-forming)/AMP-acid ligase II